MIDAPDPGNEPTSRLIRSYAVRRHDDDLDTFVDTIAAMLDSGPVVVDLSRYLDRANIIELRVIERKESS